MSVILRSIRSGQKPPQDIIVDGEVVGVINHHPCVVGEPYQACLHSNTGSIHVYGWGDTPEAAMQDLGNAIKHAYEGYDELRKTVTRIASG